MAFHTKTPHQLIRQRLGYLVLKKELEMPDYSESCWHAFQTATVTKLNGKFKIAGCCRAKSVGYANSIEEIKNFKPMQDFRKKFLDGERPVECASCYQKEAAGVDSKRTRSIKMFDRDPINVTPEGYINHDLVSWDIRPDSTCNLKCLMCTPDLSSKWEEDKEIYNKFFSSDRAKYQDLDWDYIYENTADIAKRIYVAGGEPFYIKGVVKYLQRLSEHEFNRKHTKILIQTNGTTADNRLLDVCGKFDRFDLCVSFDGVKDVDDIIRFPGKWEEKIQLWKKFDKMVNHLSISTTVQALNLPDLDNLLDYFPQDKISFNLLTHPEILSLDALKPDIIDDVKNKTKIPELVKFCEDSVYNESLNIKMQQYLLECDAKRGTDSKKTLPWCFV